MHLDPVAALLFRGVQDAAGGVLLQRPALPAERIAPRPGRGSRALDGWLSSRSQRRAGELVLSAELRRCAGWRAQRAGVYATTTGLSAQSLALEAVAQASTSL